MSSRRTGLRDPPPIHTFPNVGNFPWYENKDWTPGNCRSAIPKSVCHSGASIGHNRRFETFYSLHLRGQVVQMPDPEGGIIVFRKVGKYNIPGGFLIEDTLLCFSSQNENKSSETSVNITSQMVFLIEDTLLRFSSQNENKSSKTSVNITSQMVFLIEDTLLCFSSQNENKPIIASKHIISILTWLHVATLGC